MDEPARARSRRPRNREATEASLLDAARRVLERDGVLAGVTLSEVADEAGVNRGQIYQYFGSRRELLRAALNSMSRERAAEINDRFEGTFRTDRREVFDKALQRQSEIKLDALLALDGETDLGLFPVFEQAVSAWRRDTATGDLPSDSDVEALHVLTAATYLGYVIFREAFAKETGITPDELDERARASFSAMLDSLAGRSGS